jgi:hypothetical protein
MNDLLKSLSQSRIGCLAVIALVLLIAGYIALSMIYKARTSEKPLYEVAPTLERTSVELNGVTYQIPGGIAYIDGRDFSVDPPETQMDITLWDAPAELIEIATMHHNDKVQLLDHRRLPDGRDYVKVNFGGYSGWVEARRISPQPTEPVGENRHE